MFQYSTRSPLSFPVGAAGAAKVAKVAEAAGNRSTADFAAGAVYIAAGVVYISWGQVSWPNALQNVREIYKNPVNSRIFISPHWGRYNPYKTVLK